MNTKLIIFDFDGTLADTTATIIKTYQATIGELNLDSRTDAACQATIGLPLKEGFRQLYPNSDDQLLERCVTTYRRIFNENKKKLAPKLYTGVKDTLAALAKSGIEMTIASSRSYDSLVEFCTENGIEGYFSLMLGADSVRKAKPDPEPVLVTLDRVKKSPEETIVVGDMPVDIAMGAGAGCKTVGVTYGNSDREALVESGATFVIDSFAELKDFVS